MRRYDLNIVITKISNVPIVQECSKMMESRFNKECVRERFHRTI